MEILKVVAVEDFSWSFLICAAAAMFFVITMAISMAENSIISFIIFAILAIIVIIIMFNVPMTTPTGKMEYTVEITDSSQFSNLIKMGYSIKEHPFEGREIYVIVGDVLK